ncbi:MAG: hypothetical protein AAF485_32120 [Chloroflexota bacterium]
MSRDHTQPVIFYISAAADLMAERELLARLIAQLPVTLPWQIVQSPVGFDEHSNLELVGIADIHLLLLGGDIRAPIGLELYTARRFGKQPLAFLKRGLARTSAGEIFRKESKLPWEPFTTATDLSRQVQQWLVRHLVQQASHYGLTVSEVEKLQALQTDETDAEQVEEGRINQDVGRSAVILSRERYIPSEGILVDGEANT